MKLSTIAALLAAGYLLKKAFLDAPPEPRARAWAGAPWTPPAPSPYPVTSTPSQISNAVALGPTPVDRPLDRALAGQRPAGDPTPPPLPAPGAPARSQISVAPAPVAAPAPPPPAVRAAPEAYTPTAAAKVVAPPAAPAGPVTTQTAQAAEWAARAARNRARDDRWSNFRPPVPVVQVVTPAPVVFNNPAATPWGSAAARPAAPPPAPIVAYVPPRPAAPAQVTSYTSATTPWGQSTSGPRW